MVINVTDVVKKYEGPYHQSQRKQSLRNLDHSAITQSWVEFLSSLKNMPRGIGCTFPNRLKVKDVVNCGTSTRAPHRYQSFVLVSINKIFCFLYLFM